MIGGDRKAWTDLLLCPQEVSLIFNADSRLASASGIPSRRSPMFWSRGSTSCLLKFKKKGERRITLKKGPETKQKRTPSSVLSRVLPWWPRLFFFLYISVSMIKLAQQQVLLSYSTPCLLSCCSLFCGTLTEAALHAQHWLMNQSRMFWSATFHVLRVFATFTLTQSETFSRKRCALFCLKFSPFSRHGVI